MDCFPDLHKMSTLRNKALFFIQKKKKPVVSAQKMHTTVHKLIWIVWILRFVPFYSYQNGNIIYFVQVNSPHLLVLSGFPPKIVSILFQCPTQRTFLDVRKIKKKNKEIL